MHNLCRFLNRSIAIVEQLDQAGRQLRHVPDRDVGLIAKGIAPLLINRAEYPVLMKGIHEGAGAVINGLTGYRAIVRVHHTVDEANGHPARHQIRLRRTDRTQQVHRALSFRVVALNGIFRQGAQVFSLTTVGKDLKSADPQMALGDPGQDRAGQGPLLAPDLLSRGDGGQGTGCGNAQGMHRL